jgi:hypothetical protein
VTIEKTHKLKLNEDTVLRRVISPEREEQEGGEICTMSGSILLSSTKQD